MDVWISLSKLKFVTPTGKRSRNSTLTKVAIYGTPETETKWIPLTHIDMTVHLPDLVQVTIVVNEMIVWTRTSPP